MQILRKDSKGLTILQSASPREDVGCSPDQLFNDSDTTVPILGRFVGVWGASWEVGAHWASYRVVDPYQKYGRFESRCHKYSAVHGHRVYASVITERVITTFQHRGV